MRLSRLVPVAAVLGASGLVAGALPAAAAPERPHVTVKDGRTQPTFSFQDAIRQQVYVETDVDSDHDGKKDRVAVFVTRPKETDGGLKVASIMEASPYYAGLQDPPYHPADVTDYPRLSPWTPPTEPPAPTSYARMYYDNYFVSRGYAVLAADTLGTGNSDGCPTAIGPNEVNGMKKAVQWLTGDAKAYDASGNEVKASWSTGDVAMAGKSYDGTLPLAAASTGVKGLKTVVSVSGVANWYDYYRANGGVVAPDGYEGEDLDLHAKAVLSRKNPQVCAPEIHDIEKKMDRVTGDYNATWDVRNFAKKIGNFKASVFMTGGLNDWNVKPSEMALLWNSLKKTNLNRKLWLHQGQHDDPLDVRQGAWLDSLNLWFAHELYGVKNDVMRQPKVDIERSPGAWETYREWPAPSARPVSLGFTTGKDGASGVLGARGKGEAAFVDAPSRTAEDLVTAESQADPNRLLYVTPALKNPVKFSGTANIKVRASVDGRSPYLSAVVVDYGTDTRPTALVSTQDRWCYGDSIPSDQGCRAVRKYQTASAPFKIVTRGWTDIRNRQSIWRQSPVKAGKDYTFSWNLVPEDYVFKAGHRIGVMLVATDHAYTLRYPAGTQVRVDLGHSAISLPLTSDITG